MFSRLICFVLVGLILFQIGCSKTASIVRPELHQGFDFSLPRYVKVTLRSKVVLHGTRYVFLGRAKAIAWRTDEISGKLVAWNNEMASIKVRSIGSKYFKVPIKSIEKIEVTQTDRANPCIFGGGFILGAMAVVWVIFFIVISEYENQFLEYNCRG